MKTRWLGILFVIIVAAGIVAYKLHNQPPATAATTQTATANPQVLLVANLHEANDPGDNCSIIIHLVRQAGKRGIPVQELYPNSPSPLIKRYHVLTIPTLLVLRHGKVVSRYQGETDATVQKIQARLAQLEKAQS